MSWLRMMVTSRTEMGKNPNWARNRRSHVVDVPKDQVIEPIEPRRGADQGQAQLDFPVQEFHGNLNLSQHYPV